MFMKGEHLESVEDLKRCLSLEELIYHHCSGGLEIWLRKIGELEKAEQISRIEKNNAYLLLRLYAVFGWNPDLSEEELHNLAIP